MDKVQRAKIVLKILNKLSIDFAVLGDKEGCTGDPARRAGNEYLFQMQAAQNSQWGQSRLANELQARANSAKAAKAAIIEARAKSQDAATAFAQGGLNRSMFGQHGPVSYSGNYRVG